MSGWVFGIAILYIDKGVPVAHRLTKLQADTSGVDWPETNVGKSRIFQSIADVNDVILV